jgi:hypothetical protein
MRRLLFTLLVFLTALPAAAEGVVDDRFLLVVGVNGSDVEGVPPLRYADDDAARFYELLASGATESRLLVTFDSGSAQLYPQLLGVAQPPSRANLERALDELYAAVRSSQEAGRTATLHVFFGGHGALTNDPESPSAYLALADSRWTREDMLSQIIQPEVADYTHLVVDACNAFFLVQGRGWVDDAVDDADVERAVDAYVGFGDVLNRHPRVGVLLSTAGAQEVFEWGEYQAGVFSHQLRSALVGAADVDADGQLTYDEVVAYIAAANSAVQNPEARISATASAPGQNPQQPMIALDQLGQGAVLQLPSGSEAHYVFEDERGLRYADVTTAGDRELQVVLSPGGRENAVFYVQRGEEEARVELGAVPERRQADGRLRPTGVSFEDLEWSPVLTASRSAVADEFRLNLFAVPYSAAFFYGYTAGVRDGEADAMDVTVTTGDIRPRPRFGLVLGSFGGSAAGAELEVGGSLALHVGRKTGWHALAEVQFAPMVGISARRTWLGLGGGGTWALSRRFSLGGEALIGNQWTVDNETGVTRRDNVGLRAEARVIADLRIGENTVLGFYAGPAAQLSNELRTTNERSLVVDRVQGTVGAGVRLRYEFGGDR